MSGVDYVGVEGYPIVFTTGQEQVCHTIEILDDNMCEMPFEDFVSVLEYSSGRMPIYIIQNTTTVYIDEMEEQECGEFEYEISSNENLY